MAGEWYNITDIDRLDTPALVVYPKRVKYNIEQLISMIDEAGRLRIHVKTHKAAEPVRLMMQAGITKFKCATIAEAEMLGLCRAPDVLLAYQPAGPKLQRFIELIKEYPATKYACLIDNEQTANHIARAALQHGIVVLAYVDLNVGMNRTGIVPGDAALQLYINCSAMPGIELVGLHAYDGHIHDHDFAARTRRCHDAFAPVEALQQLIIEHGAGKPVIVAGGSPTFPIHARHREAECSPGTFIYWDWGYGQAFQEQTFLPAALVITRVVSLPSADTICLDAGHKSVASESVMEKRIHFLNAPHLQLTGHSEEHLTAKAGEGHGFSIGDVLYGIPYHICPTVALYERVLTVENGHLTGEWETIARDRKINI